MDSKKLLAYVEKEWDDHIVDTLSTFITIPNQSPSFDPEILTNGFQEQAVELLTKWVLEQKVPGLSLKVVQEKGRTPVIFCQIEPDHKTEETILMYGHFDKQPPMDEGWLEGLDPRKPVIREGKLYGRGAADDGYALFASVAAIKALKDQKLSHARIVILIEGCEESGSRDLPFYMEKLADEIGTPSLVVCLDSGCGNYEQLWITTSLRGLFGGDLRVDILTEGVHSGSGSGIVPSSFRIARELFDRLEDKKTGKLLLPEMYCDIPDKYLTYAKEMAETLGDSLWESYPFVEGAGPVTKDVPELILNRTWRPTLCVTGIDGIPHITHAGNVLRSHTTFTLSIRLPPNVLPDKVESAMRKLLESEVPYGAKATLKVGKCNKGWVMPPLEDWLEKSIKESSEIYFNKPSRAFGEGGSIPFMGMLGARFPKTQFVITGVLGPHSNAHGPNEFLHIPMAKRLTACVSHIIYNHFLAKDGAKSKKRKAGDD